MRQILLLFALFALAICATTAAVTAAQATTTMPEMVCAATEVTTSVVCDQTGTTPEIEAIALHESTNTAAIDVGQAQIAEVFVAETSTHEVQMKAYEGTTRKTPDAGHSEVAVCTDVRVGDVFVQMAA